MAARRGWEFRVITSDAIDKAGRLRCSAGFQPAVSPISNRQDVDNNRCAALNGASAGWKHRDTAGWKPALRKSGLHLSPVRLFSSAPVAGNTAWEHLD